ncbi:MAG TPA: hypothetical protein VJ978_14420 [Nitriliruptoraceae bacterium]|nr:hypothetical protein [Nitriliruptoraceae bacterium]
MDDARVWMIVDRKGRVRAVGAGSRAAPYGRLGKKLDRRRDKHGKVKLGSGDFTTPEDARRAAALVAEAIELAGNGGKSVHVDDDVAATGSFAKGLPTRRKVLHYQDLHHAVVVRISLDELMVDGRLVSGRRHPKQAAEVVRTSWPLARVLEQSLPVRRLVAVTDGEVEPARVVGIWKVGDHDTWVDHGDGNISVGLKKRKKGDRGGHAGRRFDWDGYQPTRFGYSHDLRIEAGLVDEADEEE